MERPLKSVFQIANTGTVPFYIPPIIEAFGRSGFDVQVLPPPGSKRMMKIVTAGDPGPGPEFTIQEQAASANSADWTGPTKYLQPH